MKRAIIRENTENETVTNSVKMALAVIEVNITRETDNEINFVAQVDGSLLAFSYNKKKVIFKCKSNIAPAFRERLQYTIYKTLDTTIRRELPLDLVKMEIEYK